MVARASDVPASLWRAAGRHRVAAALVAITLVALALRCYRLGDRSFWYDEAATVLNVREILHLPPASEGGLIGMMARERVPPLYFLLVAPLYAISDDDAFLRLASLLPGIATVPLLFVLASRLFGTAVGLAAAGLLAVSPFHVYYSQELRPYSLFLFLAVVLFLQAHTALRTGRGRHMAWLALTGVLGLYTHTYFVFPLLICNLYFLLGWRQHRGVLRGWILAHAAIFIAVIPELYHAWYHVGRGNVRLSSSAPTPRIVLADFYVFTFGRFVFPRGGEFVPVALLGAVIAAGILLGSWAVARRCTDGRPRALLLSACGTYAILIALSLTVVPLRDEARTNYVIFFLPFFHVLASLGWLRAVRAPLGFASLAAASVLSLLALRPVYFQWQEVGKGDFRGAAATIRARLGEGDAVFHTRTDTTYPFAHYVDWDVPQVNLGRVKEPRFDAHQRVWVVAFLPESGVSFGLRRMGDRRAVRTPAESETFVRAEAQLAHLGFRRTWERSFPGKNEIFVLLYEKDPGPLPVASL